MYARADTQLSPSMLAAPNAWNPAAVATFSPNREQKTNDSGTYGGPVKLRSKKLSLYYLPLNPSHEWGNYGAHGACDLVIFHAVVFQWTITRGVGCVYSCKRMP